MKFLWFVAVVSGGLLAATLFLPALTDWALLAAPCLVASIYLMLRQLFLAPIDPPDDPRDAITRWGPRVIRPRPPVKPHNPVVVDGSNVMHWNDGKPSLQAVRLVLQELVARGFSTGIIFDANAGWKLQNSYLDDHSFARQLNMPEDKVLVVPKGVSADEYILKAARQLKARVVTNDRFRDWAEQFPEVHDPDFLIRGGVREGYAWLDDKARKAVPTNQPV